MELYDEALVELALVVVDDVGAGGHVRGDEDVAPVLPPPRIALVLVRRRRYLLYPLRILSHLRRRRRRSQRNR